MCVFHCLSTWLFAVVKLAVCVCLCGGVDTAHMLCLLTCQLHVSSVSVSGLKGLLGVGRLPTAWCVMNIRRCCLFVYTTDAVTAIQVQMSSNASGTSWVLLLPNVSIKLSLSWSVLRVCPLSGTDMWGAGSLQPAVGLAAASCTPTIPPHVLLALLPQYTRGPTTSSQPLTPCHAVCACVCV